MSEPQVLHLPYPPSTNSLWRSVKGRNIASAEYRAWKVEAGWVLTQQRPQRVDGEFRFTMVVTRPDRRRRDLSNTIKAVEDLLVAHGVIDDDCLATSIRLSWSDAAPDKTAGVRVTVEPA